MPKFKKLMIQFQENAHTDGKKDGWNAGKMDGKMDRPDVLGPF